MSEMKTILVTGTSGMIGSSVAKKLLENGHKVIGVDRCEGKIQHENYTHIIIDLAVASDVIGVFENSNADRVIHLAAVAHAFSNGKITWEDYYTANVLSARNVFIAASQKKIPTLFISTADVYGFTKGTVDAATTPEPVSNYAKSKVLAEKELIEICREFGSEFDIFRFAPVYTDEIKRDIQKRYYLKYPDIAYIIGDGTGYEFLNINVAVDRMAEWAQNDPQNTIHNIKNEKLINTAECLEEEIEAGRAKHVLHFPKWLVRFGFGIIFCLTGKNKYTYLLGKAVNPIRTK